MNSLPLEFTQLLLQSRTLRDYIKLLVNAGKLDRANATMYTVILTMWENTITPEESIPEFTAFIDYVSNRLKGV